MRNHSAAIEVDSQILRTQEASYACAISRAAYFPLADAEFSAAGCIDAPVWIPAGNGSTIRGTLA